MADWPMRTRPSPGRSGHSSEAVIALRARESGTAAGTKSAAVPESVRPSVRRLFPPGGRDLHRKTAGAPTPAAHPSFVRTPPARRPSGADGRLAADGTDDGPGPVGHTPAEQHVGRRGGHLATRAAQRAAHLAHRAAHRPGARPVLHPDAGGLRRVRRRTAHPTTAVRTRDVPGGSGRRSAGAPPGGPPGGPAGRAGLPADSPGAAVHPGGPFLRHGLRPGHLVHGPAARGRLPPYPAVVGRLCRGDADRVPAP